MAVWKIYRLPQTFAGFSFAGIRDEAILAPSIGWPNVNEACYRNHDISASCILHQRELQGSVERKGICMYMGNGTPCSCISLFTWSVV